VTGVQTCALPICLGQSNQIRSLQKILDKMPNVEWRDTTNALLTDIFYAINAHIAMSSGTTVEASFFGIRTLAIDPRFSDPV
jgi:hypothetical protein